MTGSELGRLVGVMHALRMGCPWDAEQTHRSLVAYLVEETLEVVEAIEAGDDESLREELGDLLLQVLFHSEIAAEQGRFTIEDVAGQIADKLLARHPYVFADADVPDDLMSAWEATKRAEKGRTSALDGIPDRLSAVTRLAKVVARSRFHHVALELPETPISAEELGQQFVSLVARAQASGIDPEQAARDAMRHLEAQIVESEAAATPNLARTPGATGPGG